jgi:acyl carrier protein phosphodiesterase
MNYLGHLYLAGSDPDLQVGGLLGDFVKGPLRGEYPPRIEAGIQLHRRIDTLCDSLPATRELLALFPAPWRRYGGIVIDVVFDHLLARDWDDFHPQPLADFCQTFYRALNSHRDLLPERAQALCDHAPALRWLESYRDPAQVPRVLTRIGERLRRPVSLEQAWLPMQPFAATFEQGFRAAMAALTTAIATPEPGITDRPCLDVAAQL